jgi:hypothetical protein
MMISTQDEFRRMETNTSVEDGFDISVRGSYSDTEVCSRKIGCNKFSAAVANVETFLHILHILELIDWNCTILSDFEYRHIEVYLAFHTELGVNISNKNQKWMLLLRLALRRGFCSKETGRKLWKSYPLSSKNITLEQCVFKGKNQYMKDYRCQ